MNKLIGFGRKYRRSFWFALLINAIFMALLLLFVGPQFETNDDVALASMFNRTRSAVEAWTDLAGYLYGAVMVALYRMTTKVPWHSVVMYAVTLLSMSAVTYVILNRFEGWAGMILSSIFMIFYAYECYIVVNFTKVSAAANAAGVFLVFSSLTEEKISWRRVLWGALLVVTGYSIRTNEGLGIGLVMTSGGVYLLLLLFQYRKGERLRRFLGYAAALIPVAVLMLCTKGLDTYALHKSPEREYYKEYSDVRTRIVDHGFPPYDENREVYEKLNINENAWMLYRVWNFYDPEKFSPDVMKQVAALQPEDKITKATVDSFLKQYPDRFMKNAMFLVWLLLVALVVIYGRRGWVSAVTVIYQFLLMMGTELYLFSDRRYGLSRVELGLWFGASLILVLMLDEKKFKADRRTAVFLILLALAMNQTSWSKYYRRLSGSYNQRIEENRKVVEQLTADKDHLYICDVGSYPVAKAYGPFQAIPEGTANNIVPLGSWSAGSLPYIQTYKDYGVTNPYRDMVGNEKVLAVLPDAELILTYIRDYYDPDCKAEVVGRAGESKIYSFHD